MALGRRDFLKVGTRAASLILLQPWNLAKRVAASTNPPQSAMAILIDVSKCIGCWWCYAACKNRFNLPETMKPDPDKRPELSPDTCSTLATVKKGNEWRFAKWQCMHCVYPTCVSVCPTEALYKTKEGPVLYDKSKCIGCQYCVTACPFGIPQFDWEEDRAIRKCTMCADRIATGQEPACVEACPTGALTFGHREAVISKVEEAEARGAYVYGVEEVGGTSWMYVSDVAFDDLGFPKVGKTTYPNHSLAMLGSQLGTIVVGTAGLGFLSWYLKRRRELGP